MPIFFTKSNGLRFIEQKKKKKAFSFAFLLVYFWSEIRLLGKSFGDQKKSEDRIFFCGKVRLDGGIEELGWWPATASCGKGTSFFFVPALSLIRGFLESSFNSGRLGRWRRFPIWAKFRQRCGRLW